MKLLLDEDETAPEWELSLQTDFSNPRRGGCVYGTETNTLTVCYYSEKNSGLDLIRPKHTLSEKRRVLLLSVRRYRRRSHCLQVLILSPNGLNSTIYRLWSTGVFNNVCLRYSQKTDSKHLGITAVKKTILNVRYTLHHFTTNQHKHLRCNDCYRLWMHFWECRYSGFFPPNSEHKQMSWQKLKYRHSPEDKYGIKMYIPCLKNIWQE